MQEMLFKNNLNIGVDVDGTLNDLNKYYIEDVSKMLNKKPLYPNEYNFNDIFGFNKFEELLYGSKVLEKYCRECPLRANVKEVLDELAKNNCELHLITARKFVTQNNILGKHYRKLLERWLKYNNLEFNSIQYCSEKFSPRDKLLGCKKLHVDVMIEDKPDVAMYLAENGIKIILIDTPYNKDIVHKNIIRVNDWIQVKEEINKLNNNFKLEKDFSILTREKVDSMNSEEKVNYYNGYYNFLKKESLKLNKEELNKGKRIYKLIYKAMYPVMKLKFNPIVDQKENIPYQGGKIMCPNHVKSCDNYLIDLGMGNNQYYAGFAASEIKKSFRGRIFNLTKGAVFIDRKDPESRKKTAEELAIRAVYGDNVLIFPEGTRKNKTEEGRSKIILPFHKGSVAMAQKTGTAILPIAIYYGKRNRIKFGELFYVSPTDDIELSTEKLQNIVKEMVEELMYEDKEQKIKKISRGNKHD